MTTEAASPTVAGRTGTSSLPAPEGARPEPTFVIRPSKGWRALNLRELWEYRELLYFLVWKDLKVRYKQTVLGVAWAVIQPVLMALIFYLIFGLIGGISTGTTPKIVFYLSALIPWTLFSRGLTEASASLVENQAIITKVYFPRLLLPIAEILSALVDLGLTLIVLAALMIYYQIVPPWEVITLPLFLGIALLATFGISFWLSPFNAKYRDVRYTVPFLTQLWLFATPIAYPINRVPADLLWIYSLNPMVSVVQGFQWALFAQPFSFGLSAWISIAMVILIFVGGLFYFRHSERTLADIV
jgi:lipopolysaccharide transport system permease protein